MVAFWAINIIEKYEHGWIPENRKRIIFNCTSVNYVDQPDGNENFRHVEIVYLLLWVGRVYIKHIQLVEWPAFII